MKTKLQQMFMYELGYDEMEITDKMLATTEKSVRNVMEDQKVEEDVAIHYVLFGEWKVMDA